MSLFKNILYASLGSYNVGTTNPEPEPTPEVSGTISVLNIGDSISRGTNETYNITPKISGDADPQTLYEWDGTQIVEITEDVLNANSGSPYPGMASKFVELGADKLHVVNTGVSGADISIEWSGTDDLYKNMLVKANNYLADQNLDRFDAIRITAGINDVIGNRPLRDITIATISLIEKLHNDFPDTPIVFNQLGRGRDNTLYYQVRDLIDNVIAENYYVFPAKDLLEYPEEDYFDGIHLYQTINNDLGAQDAVYIATAMANYSTKIRLTTPDNGDSFNINSAITISSKV